MSLAERRVESSKHYTKYVEDRGLLPTGEEPEQKDPNYKAMMKESKLLKELTYSTETWRTWNAAYYEENTMADVLSVCCGRKNIPVKREVVLST